MKRPRLDLMCACGGRMQVTDFEGPEETLMGLGVLFESKHQGEGHARVDAQAWRKIKRQKSRRSAS